MSELPTVEELGTDLLVTTPWQRRRTLARPFLGVAVFVLVAWLGWWWLTPLVVFGIFVAIVTATHDVVHRAIGLGERQTAVWLFLLGLVLLESGHAYQMTHRQHHRLFPSPEDPEGYPANLSFLGAVLYGPVFLVRLWIWSMRRADWRARCWLVAEGAAPILALTLGVVAWTTTPYVLVYTAMAIIGSWVYPLLTVYLPHHDYGDEPLQQTRTCAEE